MALPPPLNSLHEAAGARLADRPEAPGLATPLTYGDVPAEYRAGREGCLLLDETTRGGVRVGGPDAAGFLHRILANRVHELARDQGGPNLLLTPKGKVRQAFELDRHDDAEFIAVGGHGGGEALRAAFDEFHFTEDLALGDASAEMAPIDLVGPRARELATAILGPFDELAPGDGRMARFEGTPLRVRRVRAAGSDAVRVDGGPALAERLWRALVEAGATPGGLAARDSLRVEALAALFGQDVDDNVYPQEARLEHAFSLEKGCYVGQEVVAKIDTYGGLNKRLVGLAMGDEEPVERGTPLRDPEGAEERDLGLVTSWAWSFELDTGMALAYVRRGHDEQGTFVRLGASDRTAEVRGTAVRPDAAA